jgi:hypothetical protein
MDGQLELVEWIHRVIGSEDPVEDDDLRDQDEVELIPLTAAVSVDR